MIKAWEINKNNRYLEQAQSVASQKTNERREETIENGKGRYSYQATLATAQKVNWRIEDIIGGDKRLDFSKSFMPESLARVEPLDFLRADEKRTLNQIRGAAYLGIFGLVEEFILPFVLDRPPAASGRRLSRARAAAIRQRRGQTHPPLQTLP